jgi:hypothetical protein
MERCEETVYQDDEPYAMASLQWLVTGLEGRGICCRKVTSAFLLVTRQSSSDFPTCCFPSSDF